MFDEGAGDDFGKDIIPSSIGKYKTLSYQYEGYWTDIGTIESFYEANLDLCWICHSLTFSLHHRSIPEQECFHRQKSMVPM